MFEDMFDKVMDESFNDFKKTAMESIGEGLREYETDQKRPCITALPYRPVPAEKVEAIKAVRTGLFRGGFKKKLLASIADGRTGYAEVLLLARANKVVDINDDDRRFDTYQIFYKVADLDGRVVRYDVPMIDDRHSFAFEYNNGDSASDTGCPDVVDPGNYQHVFLLKYYLGDDQNFVLLTKEQFEHLEDLVKKEPLGGYNHATSDGVGYLW